MAETFQAQRQSRQNRQLPRLRAASVSSPRQPAQAQLPAPTWATARARSNIRTIVADQGGNRGKTYAARCECAVAAPPNLRYGSITRRPPGQARREGS